MNKEFIPYDEAIQLKELGFDLPSISGYSYPNSDKLLANAILYQQAFRWFREKHKLVHEIHFGNRKIWIRYGYNSFVRALEVDNNNDEFYHTYEEAEIACLQKLIEIVKQKP